ncbi:putative cell cycle protein kinase [Xylaria bambusicola]|uniref:putative cell cycle protein kinase n=1 Tax=Xylaria bambusicola TaxID=326684 RepID=UPI0020079BB8|nr:putative cell cycle protein kinase [Xylaria bambusicola]KAI0505405.1 putative cell cycle protein kinase [Xylaria bambusicola]
MEKRSFHIHEDNLALDHMLGEQEQDELARSQSESQSQTQRAEDDYDEHEPEPDDDDDADGGAIEDKENDDHDEDASESSEDDESIDVTVQQDMEKLQQTFPHFRDGYRLIKRIGEGTFSTVYKAEDIRYHDYINSWDIDADESQWTPPPLKSSATHNNSTSRPPRRRKFVAIKKIYVTSSPARILNELDLLHDLRESPSVCPLITALRESDQVLIVLPYFRHQDFRKYYPKMNIYDTRVYLRSLFMALAAVHERGIVHRDIKPTNFLYDPDKKRGVLVDFGLAEREGTDSKPCLCHEDRQVRKHRLQHSVAFNSIQTGAQPGYPKVDTRPSRRANRAGTRGFRAPEVLFKCTEQTTKIDIWSAGVILLTILCKRFPFFNSADDIEAMIEIATIFGSKRMKLAGQLHGCMFDTTIPTISSQGFSFEKIMLWSTCRSDGGKDGTANTLTPEEKEAIEFLTRCMDLDPGRRISAEEALQHPFLQVDEEPEPELDAEEVMML